MTGSESKYRKTAEKMDEALFALIGQKDLPFITVKELCRQAGVHRSTFYLHYENIGELLEECIAYLNQRFEDSFRDVAPRPDIAAAPLERLNFITPAYLLPYLRFIQENARFFRTALQHTRLFGSLQKAESLTREIFSPVLRRYHWPEAQHKYVLAYYLNGMIAIITEWIRNDLRESPEEIAGIIMKCVLPNAAES